MSISRSIQNPAASTDPNAVHLPVVASAWTFASRVHRHRRAARIAVLLGVAAPFLLACTSPSTHIQFEKVPQSSIDESDPLRIHPPLVTVEDFKRFDHASIDVISGEDAGSGVTGARKVIVQVDDHDQAVVLKTKNFPPGLDGINNSPRREMAAYTVQSLFLDPVDYVVPTVGVRCQPLEIWDEYNSGVPVRVPGTECALVSYAFWLDNVTLPDPLYDEQRFVTDARYAYHLANYNLLTYLTGHHDQRLGNVLVSKNDADRRVFAIDNGTTFDPIFFNWFYPPTFAWRGIIVPAVPKKAIDRLRKLSESDLETLGVVVQLEVDEAGILRVEKPGEAIDEDEGVRVRGTTVQLGLTEDEIEDVWERIEDLLREIDDGKIGLF